jgi:DNA polymerase III subunit gamma/tau
LAEMGGAAPRPAAAPKPAPAPRPAATPKPAAAPAPAASAAPRPAPKSGPSPFELDRAKKASRPDEPQDAAAPPAPTAAAPAPMAEGDVRQQLHSYLSQQGLAHLADAVENARITVSGSDLQIVAPKSYQLYFKDAAFTNAVREVLGKPLRLSLTAGETGEIVAPLTASPSDAEEDARQRALANPEVQRFQEVFQGSRIHKVRNLKE